MNPIMAASYVREVEIKYRKLLDVPPEMRRLANSAEVYRLFKDELNSERVEMFYAVLLNSNNQIMCVDKVSRGSLNTSVVHPRETFVSAVHKQAAAVMFMHNHPSGDPAPSREDRDCTERLVKAGQLLGIRVLDHIIFGHSDYFSFADAGQLQEGVQ